MAKKKLSDYAHLYVGGRCTIVNAKGKPSGSYFDFDADRLKRLLTGKQKYKLFLRPLEDMTDEEAREIYGATDPRDWVANPKCALIDKTFHANLDGCQWAIAIRMMLAKSFDLFDLIEEKLAIAYEKK